MEHHKQISICIMRITEEEKREKGANSLSEELPKTTNLREMDIRIQDDQ